MRLGVEEVFYFFFFPATEYRILNSSLRRMIDIFCNIFPFNKLWVSGFFQYDRLAGEGGRVFTCIWLAHFAISPRNRLLNTYLFYFPFGRLPNLEIIFLWPNLRSISHDQWSYIPTIFPHVNRTKLVKRARQIGPHTCKISI